VSARIQLTLAAALLLVAAALGGVLLFGSSNASERVDLSVGPEGFAGAVSPPGVRAPPFRLQDENGAPIGQADARGKVAVITFLYTTCTDTCPITATQILGALDDLGATGRDVVATAISVDPANDTRARARRFLLERRITGRMHFALGTSRQLLPLWCAYGVTPQGQSAQTRCADGRQLRAPGAKGDFEHSSRVVVVDKRGYERSAFPLNQLTPEGLAHDIRRLQGGR
jgi:protein SCO1/2